MFDTLVINNNQNQNQNTLEDKLKEKNNDTKVENKSYECIAEPIENTIVENKVEDYDSYMKKNIGEMFPVDESKTVKVGKSYQPFEQIETAINNNNTNTTTPENYASKIKEN